MTIRYPAGLTGTRGGFAGTRGELHARAPLDDVDKHHELRFIHVDDPLSKGGPCLEVRERLYCGNLSLPPAAPQAIRLGDLRLHLDGEPRTQPRRELSARFSQGISPRGAMAARQIPCTGESTPCTGESTPCT
eukprot:3703781-Pyramimonas_sp.AAC.2